MNAFRRYATFAAGFALILSAAPAAVLAGYTWSLVSPVNGTNNVNCSPLECGAMVSWKAADQTLPNGVLSAAVAGDYSGQTTYTYAYTLGDHSGMFTGTQVGQDAKVSWNPPLPANKSVTLTFDASWSSSGGKIESSTTTTFTSK
ncbi:MAG: hypothetical protein ACP5XB_18115 [Isosphaeraceae bacterium]